MSVPLVTSSILCTDLEYRYYKHLCGRPEILAILYKSEPVRWQDGFTGLWHVYYPSFTIMWCDCVLEHVEVVYPRMPLTQYLYAQNNLTNWRTINDGELRNIGIEPQEKIKW